MSRPMAITLLAFVVGIIAFSNAQLNRKYDCTTTTGFDGFCVNIYKCEPLLRMLQTYPLEKSDMEYLRSTRCGMEGKDPKVCCVPETTAVGPMSFA